MVTGAKWGVNGAGTEKVAFIGSFVFGGVLSAVFYILIEAMQSYLFIGIPYNLTNNERLEILIG